MTAQIDLKDPLVQGSFVELDVKNTDDAGNPVDLTGATAAFYLSPRADGAATISKTSGNGVEWVDESQGHLRVTLQPADTENLRGRHHFEVWVTAVSGSPYPTVKGTLPWLPRIQTG